MDLDAFIMKTHIHIAAAAALAVAALFAPPSGAQSAKITIGLAAANLDADFFNQIKQSVEAGAHKKGVKVVTVDAKGDPAVQLRQVKGLLAQKIDALIYIPAGAAAAGEPVKAARAAGIPVVAVDRNAPDAPGDTFIATDSVSAARTLGEYVVKTTQGKGVVAIIQGQLGTTPELDRDKGFNEALAQAPGLKVVAKQGTPGWHQAEGFAVAQAMLKQNPKITVFFGRADALAL
ncbi:MAG TPA: substrate-binding domain-containing protein, partial [Ramlibacter sp.]|nr:substrate-binding domain-containing protein [Ramlibacter sp.]